MCRKLQEFKLYQLCLCVCVWGRQVAICIRLRRLCVCVCVRSAQALCSQWRCVSSRGCIPVRPSHNHHLRSPSLPSPNLPVASLRACCCYYYCGWLSCCCFGFFLLSYPVNGWKDTRLCSLRSWTGLVSPGLGGKSIYSFSNLSIQIQISEILK